MYAKAGDGWAYFTDQKEHLANVPKDPASLAGDLPSKYIFAGRAKVQNIPKEKRAEFIGFFRTHEPITACRCCRGWKMI